MWVQRACQQMSKAADERYQKCKPRTWSAEYPKGLHSMTPPKLVQHCSCHGLCIAAFSLVHSPFLPWHILPVHCHFLPVFRSRSEVNSRIAHSQCGVTANLCCTWRLMNHQIWTSLAKSGLFVTPEHCMSPVYADDHMTEDCWRTSSGSTK